MYRNHYVHLLLTLICTQIIYILLCVFCRVLFMDILYSFITMDKSDQKTIEYLRRIDMYFFSISSLEESSSTLKIVVLQISIYKGCVKAKILK